MYIWLNYVSNPDRAYCFICCRNVSRSKTLTMSRMYVKPIEIIWTMKRNWLRIAAADMI